MSESNNTDMSLVEDAPEDVLLTTEDGEKIKGSLVFEMVETVPEDPLS